MSGYDEKVWAYSSTGTRVHAFVQDWADRDGNVSEDWKRAMCRKTIARHADSVFVSQDEVFLKCTRCVDLFVAMVRRAEASMEPATEAHDLGYVAPVDERPMLKVQTSPCDGCGTEVTEGEFGHTDCTTSVGERPQVRIPADMNRELLRQARAVAIAHERLFPRAPQPETDLDELHALALQMDAEETRCAEEGGRPWRYTVRRHTVRTEGGVSWTPPVHGLVYAEDAEEALKKAQDEARSSLPPGAPLTVYVNRIA